MDAESDEGDEEEMMQDRFAPNCYICKHDIKDTRNCVRDATGYMCKDPCAGGKHWFEKLLKKKKETAHSVGQFKK